MMGTINVDMIRMKIEQVQRGEITLLAAADTIVDWCEEDIKDDRRYAELAEEDEIQRKAELIHASFTTGIPDLFSGEMREYWRANT